MFPEMNKVFFSLLLVFCVHKIRESCLNDSYKLVEFQKSSPCEGVICFLSFSMSFFKLATA